jgi:hypothetical protein
MVPTQRRADGYAPEPHGRHTGGVALGKLTVARSITDGSWLGVTCTLASVKRDGLPIPLQPPRYLATDTVAASEDWQRAAQLLTRLASLRD